MIFPRERLIQPEITKNTEKNLKLSFKTSFIQNSDFFKVVLTIFNEK